MQLPAQANPFIPDCAPKFDHLILQPQRLDRSSTRTGFGRRNSSSTQGAARTGILQTIIIGFIAAAIAERHKSAFAAGDGGSQRTSPM
jgi:hypothetical protein